MEKNSKSQPKLPQPRLTVREVNEICQNGRYVLLTHVNGIIDGVNCRIADIALKKRKPNLGAETAYVSFVYCDIHTYINNKRKY